MKMLRLIIILTFIATSLVNQMTLNAQDGSADPAIVIECDIAIDEIDPFDSLRTVASESLPLGNFLVSQKETIDGPELAPEAEAVVMYGQNDSFNVVFLHLELPEYNYVRTENGMNVKLLMQSDSSILGFYTVPDEGTFSTATNMRHYQHTALVPMDSYYKLTSDTVAMIRVEYSNHRRTIALSPKQQVALREAFRCVGERVSLYPVKP